MKKSPLALYGDQFCVLDTHNLFVGSTLEDELLLLGGHGAVLPRVAETCAVFGFVPQPGRSLTSYSGGEQAILCSALLMHLLPRQSIKILFVHVLETLSAKNRNLLIHQFRSVLPQADLYTLSPDGPIHA